MSLQVALSGSPAHPHKKKAPVPSPRRRVPVPLPRKKAPTPVPRKKPPLPPKKKSLSAKQAIAVCYFVANVCLMAIIVNISIGCSTSAQHIAKSVGE